MKPRVAERQEAEAAEHSRRIAKAELVHKLRVEGRTYAQIAKAMRISTATAGRLHVEHIEQLRKLEELGAAEASRRTQDDRYEALLNTLWSQAMGGDMQAIRECRAILDSITARESKITAWISKSSDDGSSTATLIAEGSTQAYIEALRRMG